MTEMQPMPDPEQAPRRRRSKQPVPEPVPRHIVVFPAPSMANASRVADILHTGEQAGVEARSSRVVLADTRPGHAAARVYHRLGVAALDLTPDDVASFERIDGVKVVDNQERRLPPFLDVTGTVEASAYDQPALEDPGARLSASAGVNWCLQLIACATNPRPFTGRGVSVAILDTGIDADHPDLARVMPTRSFVADEDVHDVNGHGTHCAGVVAAATKAGNSFPYGVAPDVTLIIGKVLDSLGLGWDDKVLDAIDWATDLGADVVSLSLVSDREQEDPYPRLYEAVASALRDRVLFVAAAGNSSNDPHYLRPVGSPASCPSILSIGAIDRLERVAPFSCRELDPIGKLDLCAPGVAVHSSWPNSGYKFLSGTSMATPHVAGIAALLAERGGPAMRGAALRHHLLATARQIGIRRDFGTGLARFH